MLYRIAAREILLVIAAAVFAAAQTPIVIGGGAQFSGLTGQPFSAQQEIQTVETLADGTHIADRPQKTVYYRDSEGRTRTERTARQPPGFLGSSTPPVFIEIQDPIAGYRYSFDSVGRMAHRFPFAPFPAGNGRLTARISSTPPIPARVIKLAPGLSSATGSQRPRPAISNEPLGTRTIEGVLAEGVKTTTVWPVEYFGNDRPITAVRETWTSREIGMAVLIRTSDPRSGETTEKLTNISRDEPALSLFQPPADYQIVDPPAQTGQQ